MGMNSKIDQWEKFCESHRGNQLINPFSEWPGASHRKALSKDDARYGHPVEGSKTELRGKKADVMISDEITILLDVKEKWSTQ